MPINHLSRNRISNYLRRRGAVYDEDVDAIVRFSTHKFGDDTFRPWAVYSVIGRIGFGLPQNSMVVVAGKQKEYKALLITTKHIKKGEEIVVDHFMDWTVPTLLDEGPLLERMVRCAE